MKLPRGDDRGQLTEDQMPVEAVNFATSDAGKVPLLGPPLYVGKTLYATFGPAVNKVRILPECWILTCQLFIALSREVVGWLRKVVEALYDGG